MKKPSTGLPTALLDIQHVAVDVRKRYRPRPNRDSLRWDEIGGYVVSTVRFSDLFAEANDGARYETLVYSIADGEWGPDGVHSVTETEAIAAHDAACALVRGRIQ